MIYIICGDKSREFKYIEVIEEIKNINKNIIEFVFDGSIKEEEKFYDKISFNSMFSQNELIILKRAESIKDLESMFTYISKLDLNNKEIIIDLEIEESKLKKLEILINKFKVFKSYDKENKINKSYIISKLKINDNQSNQLLEMIGDNPYKIKNEVNKIIAYYGENDIDKLDMLKIREIVSIEKEYQLYECIDKIMKNDIFEVIEYIEISKDYMSIIYSIFNEFDILKKLYEINKEGLKLSTNYNKFKEQYEEIKSIFKINNRYPNPYSIFKKQSNLNNFSYESINKIIFKCWEYEKNIKEGKDTQENAVDSLLISISKENRLNKKNHL